MKNCKVVCVGIKADKGDFTQGKVYDIDEDGFITNDNGYVYEREFGTSDNILEEYYDFVLYTKGLEKYNVGKKLISRSELLPYKKYLFYKKGENWGEKESIITTCGFNKDFSKLVLNHDNSKTFFFGYRMDEKDDGYSVEVYELKEVMELKDGMIIEFCYDGRNTDQVMFFNGKYYDTDMMKLNMMKLRKLDLSFSDENKNSFRITKVTYDGKILYDKPIHYYTLKEILTRNNTARHKDDKNGTFNRFIENIADRYALFLTENNTKGNIELKVLEEINKAVWEEQ